LETAMTNCKDCRSHLPDLLLDSDYTSEHPELAMHLAACVECRTELADLQSTFALLDDWAAPEPSPFFDSRLHARLREAVAAPPEGFWERTKSFFLFSTGRQLRPAMAGALAFVLLLGGGTFAGIDLHQRPVTPADASATVNDLKILDNNVQAEQQMDQLLDDSGSSNDDATAPPTT
jgi:hypothetical protein